MQDEQKQLEIDCPKNCYQKSTEANGGQEAAPVTAYAAAFWMSCSFQMVFGTDLHKAHCSSQKMRSLGNEKTSEGHPRRE